MKNFYFTVLLGLLLALAAVEAVGQQRPSPEPPPSSSSRAGLSLLDSNDPKDKATTAQDPASKDESQQDRQLADDIDNATETDTADDSSSKAPQMATFNWSTQSINQINVSLSESGRTPRSRWEEIDGFGRPAALASQFKVFAWEAPAIKYQPLYFEDVVLERYGQTLPDYRQTIRSAFHFAKASIGLSWQAAETPTRSCDYPLGFERPGSCVAPSKQRHFFGRWSRY